MTKLFGVLRALLTRPEIVMVTSLSLITWVAGLVLGGMVLMLMAFYLAAKPGLLAIALVTAIMGLWVLILLQVALAEYTRRHLDNEEPDPGWSEAWFPRVRGPVPKMVSLLTLIPFCALLILVGLPEWLLYANSSGLIYLHGEWLGIQPVLVLQGARHIGIVGVWGCLIWILSWGYFVSVRPEASYRGAHRWLVKAIRTRPFVSVIWGSGFLLLFYGDEVSFPAAGLMLESLWTAAVILVVFWWYAIGIMTLDRSLDIVSRSET